MRCLIWTLSLVAVAACGAPPSSRAPAASEQAPAGDSDDLASQLAERRLVDLTHVFDATTLVWPTSKPFRLDPVADGVTAGGYYYAANDLFTSEHGGTHLDAPVHFAEGHQAADAVPLARLIGAAVVVDVTNAAAADADHLVTAQALDAWEAAHGAIPAGALVLVRTGYASRWPDAASYLGTRLRGTEGVEALHFPGLDPGAAEWLVGRKVAAVGIDTASIDRGQSTTYEAHRTLAAADVPILENLANLDALPARGALVLALPMKVGGGSGAPLRAVALVP